MPSDKIQLRRDTAANWTSVNPVLSSGEMGIETDTRKFKIGNGVSTWTALSYATQPYSTNLDRLDGDASAQRTALSINNVDNTSDLNKPISTATQAALDGKQDASANLDRLDGTVEQQQTALGIVVWEGVYFEDGVTYTYYGGLANNAWKINRFSSDAVKTSATIANNPSITTLAAAWAARTGLTYT